MSKIYLIYMQLGNAEKPLNVESLIRAKSQAKARAVFIANNVQSRLATQNDIVRAVSGGASVVETETQAPSTQTDIESVAPPHSAGAEQGVAK